MTSFFTADSRIIITCNKRITPFLKMETEELGYQSVRTYQTGLELLGSINDCIKLNMNLRCASQILYSITSFQCSHPDEVYAALLLLPWENIIPGDGYFSVTSNVSHPSITNTLFANVKVKDAIVDRMRNETGKRPDSGPMQDHTVIHLYWKDETAEIFLDTSGETLAKHGYRKIPGKAPMLESLAAATLLATKWDLASPFINPMCGSATIAIEAALIATGRRPGLFRSNYAFMHILGYDSTVYETEKQHLAEQVKEVEGLKIIATDISEDAINISKINAAAAGVEQCIAFDVCDFEITEIPEEAAGVVFFNPEYGDRLGDEAELQQTYARMGDFLKKRCKGYTGYIFTGNLELAKKIGLKATRRIEFFTGKIDCRLLEYELYAGTKRVGAEG